jgi:hypothetical protein
VIVGDGFGVGVRVGDGVVVIVRGVGKVDTGVCDKMLRIGTLVVVGIADVGVRVGKNPGTIYPIPCLTKSGLNA